MTEQRKRIALDVSDEYKRVLKSVASLEGKFLNAIVLEAVADKYPAMREITSRELERVTK